MQLRGEVNLTEIKSDDIALPSEPAVNPPERSALVFVERRNERNYRDTAIYEVNDPEEFFGTRYGDSTLMFDALRRAAIEPVQVIYDEGFDTEGSSWVRSSPPDHSISYRSTDQRNRPQFFRIEDPADLYGDAWGDIREMVIEIGNSEEGLERREFLYDAGPIDWQIVVGI